MALTVVDADAHVAEGAALGRAAMERWPEHVVLKTDGRPALIIEGRRYPEPEGPGDDEGAGPAEPSEQAESRTAAVTDTASVAQRRGERIA